MSANVLLKTAKQELRKLMKRKLSGISNSSLEAQTFEALITFPLYKEARRVCIYLSMPDGEIQTEKIVTHALQNSKDVFVPYLHKPASFVDGLPKRLMDMVQLQSIEDFASLQRDSWGIPTISDESIYERTRILNDVGKEARNPQGGLDLILMPGVAFQEGTDGRFNTMKRLGHGGGFYDYFLHRYQAVYEADLDHRVRLFGLCLHEQFLQDTDEIIPVGRLDSPLHGLIVGDGRIIHSEIYSCSAP